MTIVLYMSEDNKPETPADPEVVEDEADTEPTEVEKQGEIRERIANTIDQQKTGDSMEQAMKGSDSEAPAPAAEGQADVAAQGSTSGEPSDDDAALKFIEASTGRTFANKADAQKYLENLNKLVGDQEVHKAREAHKILTGLEQKFGKNSVELESYIAGLVAGETPTAEPKAEPQSEPKKEVSEDKSYADPKLLSRIEQLEHEAQLAGLKAAYPDAAEVADTVALIAREKGISYVEAFENSPLKPLVESKVKGDAERSPIVTPSNRANIDYQKAQSLGKKAFAGRATEEEKEELTRMILDI
jgi:hypothetical protein